LTLYFGAIIILHIKRKKLVFMMVFVLNYFEIWHNKIMFLGRSFGRAIKMLFVFDIKHMFSI